MNRKRARKRVVDRIDVSDSGCWEWRLKIRPNGYARVTFDQRSWYAHRLSYTAFKGDIPSGIDVCHSCDNRRCVNPEHLFLGTRKENMEDAVKKDRQAKRDSLPQSKIQQKDIPLILERVKNGEPYPDIAKDYGVVRHTINAIAIKSGVRRR